MAEKKSSYLIDIGYKYSMNQFHEFYGNFINYCDVEQEAYIDFKNVIFEGVNKGLKFKKHERKKNILTLRVDLSDKELKRIKELDEKNEIRILHDFKIFEIKQFKELE